MTALTQVISQLYSLCHSGVGRSGSLHSKGRFTKLLEFQSDIADMHDQVYKLWNRSWLLASICLAISFVGMVGAVGMLVRQIDYRAEPI